jgi:putative transposase
MKQFQTFEYQLMPNDQQERQMRLFAGSCRFVYNKALALQKQRHEQGEKKLGYVELCKLLAEWRKSTEIAWLSRVPIHPLQQELKDLERACANFSARHTDFPKFKKKTKLNSFCYPDPKQIELDQTNSRIFLPKLGWLRYHNSQEVLGDLRNVTVSLSDGKWFISIQTEQKVESSISKGSQEVEPSIPKGNAVGGDPGVAGFATLPDGSFYTSLFNNFKQHETALLKAQKSLRKAQKSLKRKVTSSNNWKEAKVKVHKIYARIANIRRELLRKTSICTDEIDRVLAQHYGFTKEELDFIIKYDIKYRDIKHRDIKCHMGGDTAEDAE